MTWGAYCVEPEGCELMNVVKGDLLQMALEGKFDVVVHGCNCHCTMGKGIAFLIMEEFPEAFAADVATGKGDVSKLGAFSSAEIVRGSARFTIINAYTQIRYKGKGCLVKYEEGVRPAFRKIKAAFAGKRIAYPKIGAGMGKGDWEVISKIIDEELAGEDHTLVEYQAAAS